MTAPRVLMVCMGNICRSPTAEVVLRALAARLAPELALEVDSAGTHDYHVGDPPELFGPKIPVVLEGTFQGDRFESDQILIRHDNTYDEKNPDRIKQADRDAQKSSASGDGGGAPTGGSTG